MFLSSPIGMILVFALTVGVLVTVHEWGHFFVARYFGVKILRFSIGFGRPIFRWHGKDGTEYVIALIPLGGYVKMLDERLAPVPSQEQSYAFNRQSVGRRIFIVAAGPLVNLLFAVLVYWGLYMTGISHIKPIIGQVREASPAFVAGIEHGQEIIAIEDQTTRSWQSVYLALIKNWSKKPTLAWQVKNPESDTLQEYSIEIPTQNADPNDNLLEKLGITQYWPEIPPQIASVAPKSPAYRAGLKKGDRILKANNAPVPHFGYFVALVQKNELLPITLQIQRGEDELTVTVTPIVQKDATGTPRGFIGIQAAPVFWPDELKNTERYNPVSALWRAIVQTGAISAFSLEVTYKMMRGQVSSQNLGGPIAIAKGASQSLDAGFTQYLIFLALLSISLGLLNLFPIPLLDGGHLLFYGIELVRGKPLSPKTQEIAMRIGFILLFSLLAFALYNDLTGLS
ncbi:MAG: RIP metalloprotease RseP [Gammaproteobacteria bacterium]|nr:RIP metalloprotease RseP [Gammaproteobacteria bacterium]